MAVTSDQARGRREARDSVWLAIGAGEDPGSVFPDAVSGALCEGDEYTKAFVAEWQRLERVSAVAVARVMARLAAAR